ncbi:MAG: hypothetical protein QNK03_07010 [Myxococcota bacterium]|nr:hypothetical protein [Myxococcota bacterium]
MAVAIYDGELTATMTILDFRRDALSTPRPAGLIIDGATSSDELAIDLPGAPGNTAVANVSKTVGGIGDPAKLSPRAGFPGDSIGNDLDIGDGSQFSGQVDGMADGPGALAGSDGHSSSRQRLRRDRWSRPH